MKYKVGDKVLIDVLNSKDSELYEYGINPIMEIYSNCVMTILQCHDYYYVMKEDKRWFWTDKMIQRRADRIFIYLEDYL